MTTYAPNVSFFFEIYKNMGNISKTTKRVFFITSNLERIKTPVILDHIKHIQFSTSMNRNESIDSIIFGSKLPNKCFICLVGVSDFLYSFRSEITKLFLDFSLNLKLVQIRMIIHHRKKMEKLNLNSSISCMSECCLRK